MATIREGQLFQVRKTRSTKFFTRKELETAVERWNLMAGDADELIFMCKKQSCRNLRFLDRYQSTFKTPHTSCRGVGYIKTVTERSLLRRLAKNDKAPQALGEDFLLKDEEVGMWQSIEAAALGGYTKLQDAKAEVCDEERGVDGLLDISGIKDINSTATKLAFPFVFTVCAFGTYTHVLGSKPRGSTWWRPGENETSTVSDRYVRFLRTQHFNASEHSLHALSWGAGIDSFEEVALGLIAMFMVVVLGLCVCRVPLNAQENHTRRKVSITEGPLERDKPVVDGHGGRKWRQIILNSFEASDRKDVDRRDVERHMDIAESSLRKRRLLRKNIILQSWDAHPYTQSFRNDVETHMSTWHNYVRKEKAQFVDKKKRRNGGDWRQTKKKKK